MKTKTILLLVAVGGMALSLLTFQWNLATVRGVGTGFILGYLVSLLVGVFSPRRR